jgi:histidine triad (HIT) family protein
MTCEYCDIIQGKKKASKVFEDDKVVAFMSPTPATIGHIVVMPKGHAPIFEAVPEVIAKHTANVANKISIAVFEAIKCEGTNIIIQNGMDAGQEAPHFSLHIIARKEGDGLMFDWVPKQMGEQEMATVELKLKEVLEKPDVAEQIPKEPEPAGEEGEKAEQKEKSPVDAALKEEEKEENYLIRQLRRMP